MKLIRKGAEADLFVAEFAEVYFPWNDEKVLIKKRISKSYRAPELDRELRVRRTIHEARLLHEAKQFVNTPAVYEVNAGECTLVMEFIEGTRAKEGLTEALALKIGRNLAQLHEGGIVHGDITTSNILMREGEVYFIDFGLGEFSPEVEPHAVDLHLLKQTLRSTHHNTWKRLWRKVIEGYRERKNAEEIVLRVKEIERRGRYVKR